jgi:hypothetical protein
MAINKNFDVKHGLEVDTNLIFANADTNKVGIGITNPQHTLHVNGGIGVTNLSSVGVATFNNLVLGGNISIGGTTGKRNYLLTSTGIGITWKKISKNSVYSEAVAGQDTFYLSYEVGTVEVYINGVRLAPNEFTAIDGSTIVLTTPCFGGEIVEILANETVPVAETEVTLVGTGLTVQDEGTLVNSPGQTSLINFVGAGVTITSTSAYGIDVTIDGVNNPPGKTIYVAVNGSDSNDGLTLDFAKRTIKDAASVATSGDTIKVSPGTYIENNPITLPEDVSVEGAELRNCIVTPQNPGSDLFWVSNGNHITDLSFQGQTSTFGAAVVAFKPLVGVASDRFFDAARIIRYNLDFIAAEAVGYLTSTDYRSPAFTLSGGDYTSCKDDIKDIFRAVCHDITRGGNSKCVGAGLSYYNGGVLQHIVGVKTETIDTIRYAAGIAKSCINNVSWTGNYQTHFTQLKDVSIQADALTGSNIDINSCANVVSAINSCVGVVTTIIGIGTTAIGTLFNRTYPGNAGIGTTNPNDPSYSPGVGNVIKGPYIRNCTNFIPSSIGMKVDGFNADPGDKDDMGITGMMSVDSYTQYNQGGIGVKISNGAYAQLVSIFTICCDQAIVTESGGQCDITNSNSSFGTKGLVSNGVSSPTTLSNYRYTGTISANSAEGGLTVSISGIGNERPYSGQALYFGELYYEIESVTVLNGGSGYTDPPTVVFLTDTDPVNGNPSGPSAIKAEAIAQVENGTVTAVNMIGNGRNYRAVDMANVTFTAPVGGGTTASGIVNLRPLYYQVRSATLPVAGVSTVTLAQTLNNDVGIGTTAYLQRQSLQIVSSHSFEYIGAGNTIETARPSKGGVTIQANEVVKVDGGEVVYTSTDQDGNFAIGEDLVIDQATGTIRGRAFERSLLNTVTPFIIALGAK